MTCSWAVLAERPVGSAWLAELVQKSVPAQAIGIRPGHKSVGGQAGGGRRDPAETRRSEPQSYPAGSGRCWDRSRRGRRPILVRRLERDRPPEHLGRCGLAMIVIEIGRVHETRCNPLVSLADRHRYSGVERALPHGDGVQPAQGQSPSVNPTMLGTGMRPVSHRNRWSSRTAVSPCLTKNVPAVLLAFRLLEALEAACPRPSKRKSDCASPTSRRTCSVASRAPGWAWRVTRDARSTIGP